MGQTPSKQRLNSTSTTSTTTLTVATTNDQHPASEDDSTILQEISRPATPPRIVRMSTLIDPRDLAAQQSTIRSPSGNMLGVNAYVAHPDRPPCIRERQERIRAEVEAAIAIANNRRVRQAAEAIEEDEDGESLRKAWCSCFRF